ncbi:SecY-interacting protein Syd [Kitasatospora sp. NPDC089509]|uniref:SecY-interacting protein Syd n=1 Tax=Kitasatospora sp. NPDC089509 TaxID=3364079 RepID=UPI0038302896
MEYDPAWQSPCQTGDPTPDGTIRWKPVPMEPAPDFAELERALAETGTTPVAPSPAEFLAAL